MGRTYWRAAARRARGIARRVVLWHLAAACTTYRPIRSVPAPHEVSAEEYNWARVIRRDLIVAFQYGFHLAWALWGGRCATSSRSNVRCS